MRKVILTASLFFVFLSVNSNVNARMMMGRSFAATDWTEVVEHTLREEKEGRELWRQFQAKEIICTDFTDEQFGVLGEYFMGQMMGDSHAAMNMMLLQMHGEEGEAQMHIVMGKRLSGCDTSASITGITGEWMPMMNMMTGGWLTPFRLHSTNNMMNFGFGSFGAFGWIFMILWWVLIIAGIVALMKWLAGGQSRGGMSGKSAVDILKERYAKGEIDKKEFEEKKKDLN